MGAVAWGWRRGRHRVREKDLVHPTGSGSAQGRLSSPAPVREPGSLKRRHGPAPRPDLDHLRHQARNLLRAAKAGDPDAIERVRTFTDRMTLSAAQRVIAREHGWVSCSAMRQHVEELRRINAVVDSSTGLEDLFAQAQSLLSDAAAGDPDANGRMRAVSDQVTLSVAQDVIAREYAGWTSWSALRHHVEVVRQIRETPKRPEASSDVTTLLEWCDRAAARWADFPVDTDPRPVVLTGPGVRLGDRIGDFKFVNSVSKRAFLCGAVERGAGVPDEPVELLRRHRRPDLHEPGATASLLITRAERSHTEFWTDRGRRVLSAWRIETPGARGAIWAMAEEALARCWFPAPQHHGAPRPPERLGLDRATLFEDEVTLRVSFRGKAESVADYGGCVIETSTAVCVAPAERPLKEETAGTAWRYASRELTVRLARPLGARVLVRPAGSPLAVLYWTAT